MKENRLKYFASKTLDDLMKVEYKDLLIDEIYELIADTPMKDINKRIAKCLYVDVKNISETAEYVGMDKRTVSTHKKEISDMLRLTLVKKVMEYDGFKDTPTL